MNNIAVVIPNHLPHFDFLYSWDALKADNVTLIVVQDIGKKPKPRKGFNMIIVDHKDIEKDLGDDAWIIPTGTSACRSYGFYLAWKMGFEHIYTLDNDCYAEDLDGQYWIDQHEKMLEMKTTLGWSLSSANRFTRGFPYKMRNQSQVYLSHGLWSNIPDFDAAQMLLYPDYRSKPATESVVIPQNNFYPMCGMNLAFKHALTPAMYFGIFGSKYGFDQFDDIFAGVLSKKIMDHLGLAVITGAPSVEHRKQSDAFTNFRKQAGGLELNEYFWQEVKKVQLTKNSITECYEELIEALPDEIQGEIPGWTRQFKLAALTWINLFKT